MRCNIRRNVHIPMYYLCQIFSLMNIQKQLNFKSNFIFLPSSRNQREAVSIYFLRGNFYYCEDGIGRKWKFLMKYVHTFKYSSGQGLGLRFWVSISSYKKQPVKKIWGRILGLAWLKFAVESLFMRRKNWQMQSGCSINCRF